MPTAFNRIGLSWNPRRVWGAQYSLDFIDAIHEQVVARGLDVARQAGLRSVRVNVRWDEIEPVNTTPDTFDWSRPDSRIDAYSQAGNDLILTLVAYPAWATEFACGGRLLPGRESDWRQFVRAVATRYSQEPYAVALWEIGNEVDGETRVRDDDFTRPPDWGQNQPTTPYGGCWGDRAPQYVEFLRMAYEEIKAVAPDARVSMGGLAYQDWWDWFHMDFVDNFLAAGGGPYTDIINYHWFAHLSKVEGQPSGPEKHRSLMARFAAYGHAAKPVWLTETYQLTYVDDPASQRDQIRFLTRDLVEILAFPEIERVYWYGLVDKPYDIGDGNLIGRGLIGPDLVGKPALAVLPYTIAMTDGWPEDISTSDVVAYRFRRPRAGEFTVVAWSRSGAAARLDLAAPGPAGGRTPTARVFRFPSDQIMAGVCCSAVPADWSGGRLMLDVGQDSVFVDVRSGPR